MGADWYVLNWIQDTLRCGFLDSLMPAVSALGNGGMIWLISAALLLCFKKYRRYGILLLLGLAAGVLAGNLFLKNLKCCFFFFFVVMPFIQIALCCFPINFYYITGTDTDGRM